MTLGGIAAAIGLVIDDAIVVVEAIFAKIASGLPRMEAIKTGIGEIFHALVGSTLTPVVVFIPLAFLEGITGVFFRALALTMVVALLTSLLLAVTLTPSLAAWFTRDREHLVHGHAPDERGGRISCCRASFVSMRLAVRMALAAQRGSRSPRAGVVFALGVLIYRHLETEFLPPLDEGGFVIDYVAPFGTSLSETNRQLLQAEDVLRATPEVESYSRRTGARLALAIAEPNTGDFLVKLQDGPQAPHRRGHQRAAPQIPRRPARHRVGIPRHSFRSRRRPDLVAGADRGQIVLDGYRSS